MSLQLKDVAKLEGTFAQLKGAYERFFLGLERQVPEREHEALRLALKRAGDARQQGAQIKLRMTNLLASVVTYEQLWSRQLAAREQARPLRSTPPEPQTTSPEASPKPDTKTVARDVQQAAAATPTPTLAPSQATVSDAALERVWRALLAQHERLGQPNPPVWSRWRSPILTQIETTKSLSGAPQVSLQLVVEGGVPNVRVVPKKGG